MKTTGVHGRHGVVEKKQSGLGNKVWIGMRMVLFGESVWYNRVRLELVKEINKKEG